MPYNYTIPRGPVAAMDKGPGPCYLLPGLCGQISNPHDPRSVHAKGPAFTFGLRTNTGNKTISPGPKYYPNPKMYRDGKDGAPHYTVSARHPPLTPFNVPGPASYRPEKALTALSSIPSAPVFSLHQRTPLLSPFKTPAPNCYILPAVLGVYPVESTKPSNPRYTMAARPSQGGFGQDLAKAPGPGTYDETSASVYKQRLPQYSIAPRVYPPGDNTIKPGPGAHRPEDWKMHETPSYTFGLKHSPYIASVMPPDPE